MITDSYDQAEHFRIRVLIGPMQGRNDAILDYMAEQIRFGDWSYDPDTDVIDMKNGTRFRVLESGYFGGAAVLTPADQRKGLAPDDSDLEEIENVTKELEDDGLLESSLDPDGQRLWRIPDRVRAIMDSGELDENEYPQTTRPERATNVTRQTTQDMLNENFEMLLQCANANGIEYFNR